MSDSNETTTPDATGATETEALQQAMVGQLMAIIGAPDDKDVARAADDIVQALDVRLREDRTAAA
ncbi:MULTISPECIES: hypothetical protein [unclassified Streptomyces]|uniref:hypothetical protein n=1 Tax=unclassified Streptomyces TaxID=2593676 RepID=UPI0004C8A125|nr:MULTISPECIES: hypothetical protein [unclassified Streptomyces]KPC78324.1 hypothetical protein ADK82_30225 [Streptomyces sp. NRRL S-4]